MRRDGRLRAHLAATSRPGRRETCDGSGGYSARLELLAGTEPTVSAAPELTRAAAFNVRAAWDAVDAFYFEWRDMKELGAASPEAVESAWLAVERALADAEALAPWGTYAAMVDGGEAV
jgi:hypothetical protein